MILQLVRILLHAANCRTPIALQCLVTARGGCIVRTVDTILSCDLCLDRGRNIWFYWVHGASVGYCCYEMLELPPRRFLRWYASYVRQEQQSTTMIPRLCPDPSKDPNESEQKTHPCPEVMGKPT